MDVNARRINIFLWAYCSFIFTFNEMISLFVSKTIYRGLYVLVILACLFLIIVSQEGKAYFRKIDMLVLIYLVYIIARWISQYVTGSITAATNTSTMQAFVPVTTYFLAIYIDNDDADKVEKLFSFFASISIIMGFLNSRIHFLPNVGSFSGELLAYVGTNGAVSVRGYSMGGSALVTGYISTLLVGFSLDRPQKLSKWIYILIGLFGIASSLSRGAVGMLLIMCLFYLMSRYVANRHGVSKRRIQMCLIILILFFLVLIFNWNRVINSAIIARLFGLGVSDNSGRANYQINAFMESLNTPIFGRGFGFTGYQAAISGVTTGVNTESYFLSLMVGIGGVGTFLFIAVLVSGLKKSINIIHKYDEKNSNMYKYGAIIFGITAWSVMYILLEADLNAVFYWYCLGRIMNLKSDSDGCYLYENK